MSETPRSEDKKLHFLVVDDDDDVRATVVEYLRALGYEKISTATNGAEAARMIERDASINFVISDWDMPSMNGLNLLQRTRANPSRSHIPFLIATSPVSEEAEKIVLAAENMVDGYIIKPFKSGMLKDKIEKMLEVPIHGPQKQVMVVDDDPDAREMMVEYLKMLGFKQIHIFQDGHKALTYLMKNMADVGLIVCDWEMPNMSGIELLQLCKSHASLIEIPFLMVTSQSSMERMKVIQAAKANVDQYLLKPFTSTDMKKRIEILLERARTRNQVQSLVAEGTEHIEHGRYQSAQRTFEDALALDPNHDLANRGLGDVLAKVKGMEAALPHYKKAVESNPYNIRNFLKLATAYEQIGLLDKGIHLLQTAQANISFSPDLHFHLGRLYNKKGMMESARSEFEKTLELQLDHQEARLMLAMMDSGRKSRGDE